MLKTKIKHLSFGKIRKKNYICYYNPKNILMYTRKGDEVILVISDLHAPYQHEDALEFLRAVQEKYQPNLVLNVGDELDYHALSFHASDPDLDSAGVELKRGQKVLKELEEIFPEMVLVDSNHGSMKYRKAKVNGIPRELMVTYNVACGVGEGWTWFNNFTTKMADGRELFMTHGMKKNGVQLAREMGMCVVQGHYHTEFNIQYCGNPNVLNWSMMVGCLINNRSMAFAYNKTFPARPILGCGLIINGQPHLIPMVKTQSGKWNKNLTF
tara:strand:+ start:118 stop:924 length:807 start_codon:yes stop_codon:yes gene_type:complete